MLKKLTERIYYMPHSKETDRPVLGLICGDKYSLVVDAGNSPAHAKEFMEAVSKLDIAPVKYLAITHWHWDHVFGIETMKLITLCHIKTRERLDYMQKLSWDDKALEERVRSGEEIEFCSEMIKKELPDRDGFKLGNADISFDEKIEVDLGGTTCIIVNIGGSHSEDSSAIYVPEDQVMFLGDSISPDLYSGERSYYIDKVISMTNKIKKYDTKTYLSSHDEPESSESLLEFLDELERIGGFAGEKAKFDNVIDEFVKIYGKEPNEDELFYIKTFINGNINKS